MVAVVGIAHPPRLRFGAGFRDGWHGSTSPEGRAALRWARQHVSVTSAAERIIVQRYAAATNPVKRRRDRLGPPNEMGCT
jgi:hypothetical protein